MATPVPDTVVEEVPDMTSQPDEFSDVILVAEGRKLHTSRALLASVSLVWRQSGLGGCKNAALIYLIHLGSA